MRKKYTTRQDAIDMEIIAPISADDDPSNYDIEAIANKIIGDYGQGYSLLPVDEDDFWGIISDNVL